MRFIYDYLISIILTSPVMFVSLFVSLVPPVFAGEINELAHEELLHNKKILKTLNKDNSGFAKYKQAANKNIENYKDVINEAKKQAIQNISNINRDNRLAQPMPIRSTPKAIIFVSFSMPNLSLKQIINDAARYQIPVVVRGLIDNSFKKTVTRVFELVKKDNKGGISINPIWFRQYSINAVPACVVKHGDKFDVVYGNIRIKNMLEIIAASGATRDVAQSILDEAKI